MLMLIYQLKKQPLRKKDFNTSHVNVNLFITSTLTASVRDFNTSHVNVNPHCCCTNYHQVRYFNTSHVNVNQWRPRYVIWENDFNTSHVNVNHLRETGISTSRRNFNTSHVNVNPMNLSLFQSRLNLSLPILSHFSKNYQPISLFLTMGLINLQPQVFTGLLEIFFINCLVNTCII